MERSNPRARASRATAVVLFVWSAAAAAAPPLSAEELAGCAQRVGALRTESSRLLAENERLDAQRDSILARQRALQAEGAGLRSNDVHSGIALHDRRRLLDEETSVFNARIERIRAEIGALNETWTDYDRLCARRPYDRRDLERLPPAAQQAMRTGLGDVRVPYIPETMSVPEGAERQEPGQ